MLSFLCRPLIRPLIKNQDKTTKSWDEAQQQKIYICRIVKVEVRFTGLNILIFLCKLQLHLNSASFHFAVFINNNILIIT